MTALRQIITAFFGGETDPHMGGRVDTEHHAYGLSVCENFVAINEGALVKRPGFEFICDADATSTWLSAFRFSITQEYLIEWGALKARFYTNGGRIETAPGVAYETVTPYAAADCPRLSFQQSYDRLYIDHAGYKPGSLSRTSAITFSHAYTELKNGPFTDTNSTEANTVTWTGATTVGAAGTLASSSAIFAAGDVGSLFRIEAKDFSTIKAWEPGMGDLTGTKVAIGDVVRSESKAYTALTAGVTGSRVPIHERGAEWDGQNLKDQLNNKGPYGVQWEYRHDTYGIVRITGFTSDTQVSAEVVRRLPDSVTSVATWRWAHSAFSATRGWPSIVVHAFGRQVHFKGLDVIGSVVGDYGGGQCNFQSTTVTGQTAADLGFRRTLDLPDPPQWAVDDLEIYVGTANLEIKIGAVNPAAAVAGDNIRSRKQSFHGSEPIWPVQAGSETIFVERGGRRVRSAGYDFGSDRFVATDLTAASRHITASGLIQLAVQRVPHGMLYAVRSDGQVAMHTLTRLQLKGWARMIPGGSAKALSGVSIVGADGKTDELWLLVERLRSDGLKKEIWRQTAWRELGDDAAEQFFVDAGVRTSAAGGQTHFSGAVHLKNTAIAVLANGGVVPGITVDAAGAFDLPATAVPATPYTLVIGLPYTARAVTVRAETASKRGSIQGLLKTARKLVLRVLDSAGLSAGGVAESDPLEELIDRPASAAMDAAVPLFSGDTPGAIDIDQDRDGRTRWISDKPLDARILAAFVSLEVDDDDG